MSSDPTGDATMAAAMIAPIPDATPAAAPPAAAAAAADAATPVQHHIGTPDGTPSRPGAKRHHVDATAPVASDPWLVKREGDMSVNVNAVFAKVLARVELIEQKHRAIRTDVDHSHGRIEAIIAKSVRDEGDLGPLACAKQNIMDTINEMAQRKEIMEGNARAVIVEQKAANDLIYEALGQKTLELDAKILQMHSDMKAQVVQMKIDLEKRMQDFVQSEMAKQPGNISAVSRTSRRCMSPHATRSTISTRSSWPYR